MCPKSHYTEPYGELEDFLDKDDFTNLLGVFGQYAGKTISFGESILNQFVFKKKESDDEEQQEEQEYVVPGQKEKPNLKQKF